MQLWIGQPSSEQRGQFAGLTEPVPQRGVLIEGVQSRLRELVEPVLSQRAAALALWWWGSGTSCYVFQPSAGQLSSRDTEAWAGVQVMCAYPPAVQMSDVELISQRNWRELGRRHGLLAETVTHLENLPLSGTLTLKDILAFDGLERKVDHTLTIGWEDVESSWLDER